MYSQSLPFNSTQLAESFSPPSGSVETPLFRRYRSSKASQYKVGDMLFGGSIAGIELSTSCVIVRNGLYRNDGTPVECRRDTDIHTVNKPTRIFTADGWRWVMPLAIDRASRALFFDVHGIDPQYAAVLDQTLAQENLRKRPTRTPRTPEAREEKTKKSAEQEEEEEGLSKMTSTMQLLGSNEEVLAEHGLGLGGMGNIKGSHYRGMTSERLTILIGEVFDMLDESNDGILVVSEVLTALGQHAGGDAEAAKDEFDMIEKVIHEGHAADADGKIEFKEWRDYWESTAAGDSEAMAVGSLETLRQKLSHKQALNLDADQCVHSQCPPTMRAFFNQSNSVHQSSSVLLPDTKVYPRLGASSAGYIAEQKASVMKEKKEAKFKRQELRKEKEESELSNFAVSMIDIVESHDTSTHDDVKEGKMAIRFTFRSKPAKLHQMCKETFDMLDSNGDSRLSFPEVLESLGETSGGPHARRIAESLAKFNMDHDLAFRLEWSVGDWIDYWSSDVMDEPKAFERLSTIRRTMIRRTTSGQQKLKSGLMRTATAVRTADFLEGQRDEDARELHDKTLAKVEAYQLQEKFNKHSGSGSDDGGIDIEVDVNVGGVDIEVEIKAPSLFS